MILQIVSHCCDLLFILQQGQKYIFQLFWQTIVENRDMIQFIIAWHDFNPAEGNVHLNATELLYSFSYHFFNLKDSKNS